MRTVEVAQSREGLLIVWRARLVAVAHRLGERDARRKAEELEHLGHHRVGLGEPALADDDVQPLAWEVGEPALELGLVEAAPDDQRVVDPPVGRDA